MHELGDLHVVAAVFGDLEELAFFEPSEGLESLGGFFHAEAGVGSAIRAPEELAGLPVQTKSPLAFDVGALYRMRELQPGNPAMRMHSIIDRLAKHLPGSAFLSLVAATLLPPVAAAQNWQEILDTPDYEWYAGCFGTGCGNLGGYWDRNGLPDLYTGPTGDGVAPLNSRNANFGIRSMWVSKAGVDGRPTNMPGHMDDYYVSYESTAADPYVTAGRPEHPADSIGDFIGLNQRKWSNLGGECAGNIDAFSFVFWDKTGNRRWNYSHTNAGQYIPDIQSGLKAWMRYRGYDADVFTQLPYYSTEKTTSAPGFTYADMKAEILAGNPVLLFLQPPGPLYRNFPGLTNANPEIHGVMAYGIWELPDSDYPNGIIIRTSWGSGGTYYEDFSNRPMGILPDYRIRGVIVVRPRPKIRNMTRSNGNITIDWDGPTSQVQNMMTAETTTPQRYLLERATSLNPGAKFTAVGSATTARTMTIPDIGQAYYRVTLLR